MPDAEETLRSAYRAFNARDIDIAIELMHPQVDWPNAWEEPDGSITVEVHQVVHDASSGELVSDSRVRHRYRVEDGLVVRMDVLEAPSQP